MRRNSEGVVHEPGINENPRSRFKTLRGFFRLSLSPYSVVTHLAAVNPRSILMGLYPVSSFDHQQSLLEHLMFVGLFHLTWPSANR